MRRATLALMLLAALPAAALAYKPAGPVDAIGMLDYRHGARFKVGDWVRYRTKGDSYQGYRTDYTVTILIAGEEEFWGEKCFWVETQTSYSGQDPEVTASLLSYSIFEDSLPQVRFTRYLRKFIEGRDERGNYLQQPFTRALSEIRNRNFAEPEMPHTTDTLGIEQVEVPKGTFEALGVREVYRYVETTQQGDSTVYYEMVEDHRSWWSDLIPITRLIRKDQENTQKRRVWMIGESQNAPLRVVEQSTGATQLLDYGTGMKATCVPERFQRPLSEQRRDRARREPGRRSSGSGS